MTYPLTNVKLRTDSDFVMMDDEEHHLNRKLSPFGRVGKNGVYVPH